MTDSKKTWFVPKSYGYGLMPVSWQGWLMTLALLIVIFIAAYSHGFFNPAFYVDSMNRTLIYEESAGFLVDMILLTGVFFYFAEKKTEGEIKWNWGNK